MALDALCAFHPDRPAECACARCGTFICVGCTVSDCLCPECRTLLHREGTPWTTQEHARARARSAIRWASWLLRAVLVSLLISLPLLTQGGKSAVAFTRPVAVALITTAVLLGVGASLSAVLGYLASRRGRPGPAIPGVVPLPTAAALALGGALPLFVVVIYLVRG